MDAISAERLENVHPQLASIVRQMDTALSLRGIHIRVVQGLRTMSQQEALFAQGRTAPGNIVTHAQAGYSAHNFGYAVDLIPGLRNVDPWQPNWDPQSDDFQAMVAVGVGLGLISGATWQGFKDHPHFQLPGLPVTPTDEMRASIQGGIESFWSQHIA